MQSLFTDESAALEQAIAERIGQQKYKIWFRNTTKLELTRDTLTIRVANSFVGNWIENHFLTALQQIVASALGSSRKVVVSVDPTLIQSSHQNGSGSVTLREPGVTPAVASKSMTGSQQNRGKILKHSLDSFVVGPKNELAFNAAKAVVGEEKSPFNPLFYHGGYGVGKTHLLQGICNAVGKARPGARWLYLSAEDFANQYVLALKTRKLEGFRQRLRQLDVLAIDDIHFLANKNAMQEEFLHTFNSIDLAGKQVVLASDAHPKMISQLSEQLVNRFVSGMVVKIEPPDYETRCRICRRRAQEIKKELPANVVELLAEKVTASVRELEGALLKLVAFASLSHEKINLTMAQEVLAEHLSRSDPIVHLSDIESAVVAYFGVSGSDLHSARKDRTISLARSFCMHLARRCTRLSFPEIGRMMGGKNHATVILANRKVEDLLKRNAEIRWIGSSGNRLCRAKDVLEELLGTISG
ncbi:MAG: chromosomal replication initiator protein DnaA [Phycisphaerae bacterium]|nr:chromosomal replication initiator protein DnaA [Phycisphaerae bacterium]